MQNLKISKKSCGTDGTPRGTPFFTRCATTIVEIPMLTYRWHRWNTPERPLRVWARVCVHVRVKYNIYINYLFILNLYILYKILIRACAPACARNGRKRVFQVFQHPSTHCNNCLSGGTP